MPDRTTTAATAEDIVGQLREAHDRINCLVDSAGFKSQAQLDQDVEGAMALCWKAADEIERLRAALQTIVDGIPRPEAAETWRDDGKPSKADRCRHGHYMYEDCDECISDFARSTLSNTQG